MAFQDSLTQFQTRGTVVEPRTDLSLLNAVVHERDHDAFTEFHQRYEKRAFNIALRILRNPSLAQDAVQETMLDVVEQRLDASHGRTREAARVGQTVEFATAFQRVCRVETAPA